MLEHLTARNSVHYFYSLVRRRADPESRRPPQVANIRRYRSPRVGRMVISSATTYYLPSRFGHLPQPIGGHDAARCDADQC